MIPMMNKNNIPSSNVPSVRSLYSTRGKVFATKIFQSREFQVSRRLRQPEILVI